MIDKQFIVDDINDFLKPNNHQWKTYFDKAECRAILDAIEKSNKYEKMVKAWDEVLKELAKEKEKEIKWGMDAQAPFYFQKIIDIINHKLEGVKE